MLYDCDVLLRCSKTFYVTVLPEGGFMNGFVVIGVADRIGLKIHDQLSKELLLCVT